MREGFEPADNYLRANIDKFQLDNGRTFWSITCIEYMCGSIKNKIFDTRR